MKVADGFTYKSYGIYNLPVVVVVCSGGGDVSGNGGAAVVVVAFAVKYWAEFCRQSFASETGIYIETKLEIKMVCPELVWFCCVIGWVREGRGRGA